MAAGWELVATLSAFSERGLFPDHEPVVNSDCELTEATNFGDHLGTARVMTNTTGITQQESTYYPFVGEQRFVINAVDNRYKRVATVRVFLTVGS